MTGPNGKRGRPMLMGDRVRLPGKELAIVGTVLSRGLAVALVAEWGKELAPIMAYPAQQLEWSEEFSCWVGTLHEPDHSGLVVLP